jgi:hypothetical protein
MREGARLGAYISDSSHSSMALRRLLPWLACLFLAGWAIPVHAESPAYLADDCVITSFNSDLTLGTDSSLAIIEHITADCGNLGKHGIFRILPTEATHDGVAQPLHITLQAITDGQGQAYHYDTLSDRVNHTVTWKIGDANVIISGSHEYVISYSILGAEYPTISGHAAFS